MCILFVPSRMAQEKSFCVTVHTVLDEQVDVMGSLIDRLEVNIGLV